MSRKLIAAVLAVVAATGVVVATATAGSAATTANVPCASNVLSSMGNGNFAYVPASLAQSTNCYLIQGNGGSGVSALQMALRDCNDHAGIAVDGSFGPATKSAVVTFQSNRARLDGLTVDGVYGVNTRNVMAFPSVTTSTGFCGLPGF